MMLKMFMPVMLSTILMSVYLTSFLTVDAKDAGNREEGGKCREQRRGKGAGGNKYFIRKDKRILTHVQMLPFAIFAVLEQKKFFTFAKSVAQKDQRIWSKI